MKRIAATQRRQKRFNCVQALDPLKFGAIIVPSCNEGESTEYQVKGEQP